MSQSLETTAEAIPRADLLAQIAKALNDPAATPATLFRLPSLNSDRLHRMRTVQPQFELVKAGWLAAMKA